MPRSGQLDIDLGLVGSGSLDIGRVARLYIDSGPFNSTSTQARSVRHRPGPAQLDIDLGTDDLTSAWARTTRRRPGTEQLNINPGPDDSRSVRARSARHQSSPFELGLDCLGSTWIRTYQNPIQNAIWIIQKCI